MSDLTMQMLPLSLCLLSLIVPLVVTVYIGTIRFAALRRRLGTGAMFAYISSLVMQHVSGACLMVVCVIELRAISPHNPGAVAVVAASLITVYGAMIALDATLFAVSGFRLEVRLGGFAMAAHDFSAASPWKLLLATLTSIALFTGVAAAGALRFLPSSDLSTVTWAFTSLFFFAFQSIVARATPVALCYEWNNLFVASAEVACTYLTWGWRVDSTRGPQLLMRQCEESITPDPTFPNLRTTRAFTGEKHFHWEPSVKPNVVLIFLESFGAREVGALGNPHKLTPHFDSLCQQGVLWERFYANGTITSRAAYAALFGVPPHPTEFSTQAAKNPQSVVGIPDLLREAGYRTAYFHDGPIEWENAREFFLNHGFDQVFAQQAIKSAYPESIGQDWNFDDRYLFKFHADWLAQQNARGQPTFSTLFTITNHFPFVAPPHAPYPDVDVPRDTVYAKYMRTFMYTDACLGAYMADIKARGLDKNTVFLILGDHGQERNLDGADFSWSGNYSDNAVRVPLLLLAPGLSAQRINEVASQVDLLPTLMDLLQIRATHHSVGTSLVRRCRTRHAVTSHPFKPSFLSIRFGDQRFVHCFDNDRSALYDLQTDPDERIDLSPTNADLVRDYHHAAWSWHAQLRAMYKHGWAPPRKDHGIHFYDEPTHMPTTAQSLNSIAEGTHSVPQPEIRRQIEILASINRFDITADEKLSLARALLRALNEDTMGLMSNRESIDAARAFARVDDLTKLESAAADVCRTRSGDC